MDNNVLLHIMSGLMRLRNEDQHLLEQYQQIQSSDDYIKNETVEHMIEFYQESITELNKLIKQIQ